MTKVDTVCLEMTLRCPLRCAHCSAHAAPERGEMMPLSLYERVLKQSGDLEEIYLSGGEPFEHPALPTFVEHAEHFARRTIVYTSGTRRGRSAPEPLTTAQLAAVAIRGVHRIDLSLYSPRAHEHDLITRTPGSFMALMETIRTLRDLGIRFGIHFVPLVEEGARLRTTASFAREIGAARFHILAIALQGRARAWPSGTSDRFLEDLHSLPEGPEFTVVRSSAIRRAMGLSKTIRDGWNAIFIDVLGNVHRSEGSQTQLKMADPRGAVGAAAAIELASAS